MASTSRMRIDARSSLRSGGVCAIGAAIRPRGLPKSSRGSNTNLGGFIESAGRRGGIFQTFFFGSGEVPRCGLPPPRPPPPDGQALLLPFPPREVPGRNPQRPRTAGGRGGIRTHGEFNPTLDFESSALNRTQPPFLLLFPTAFELAREWKPAQAAIKTEPNERGEAPPRAHRQSGSVFSKTGSIGARADAVIATALLRASVERRIKRQAPSTQRDIIAEALSDWLKKHGHLN